MPKDELVAAWHVFNGAVGAPTLIKISPVVRAECEDPYISQVGGVSGSATPTFNVLGTPVEVDPMQIARVVVS